MTRIARNRDFSARGATVFGHPNELAFIINQNRVGGHDDAFVDVALQHHLADHARQQLGIGLEEREGSEGPYTATVYSSKAQRFLLKHMDEIVEINTAKYNETVDTGALQGAPWTEEQEAQLRELYQQGISLAEIARTLQRSTSGIQARLKLLGLAQAPKRNT